MTPGARDVLNVTSSIDAVVDVLRSYDPADVIRTVSTLSAILESAHGDLASVGRAQRRCADRLFGPRAEDVMRRVVAWYTEHGNGIAFPVLFHELQLLNLMKVVLLLGADWKPTKDMNDGGPLGCALLMMNDLITEVPVGDMETSDSWNEYFVANALFNHSDNPLHRQARTHEIFFGAASGGPDGDSLYARATHLLGLSPTEYWVAHTIVGSYWKMLFPRPEAIPKNPYVNVDTYFAQLALPPEHNEKFLGLVSDDVAHVVERCRSAYALDKLRPYNLDAIARSPILRVGGDAVCFSNHLLTYRTTRGLFDNLLEREQEPKRREQIPSLLGGAFDRYVTALLKRAFPRRSDHKLIPEEALKDEFPSEPSCDSIVHCGDTAVLLENKSIMFAQRVRAAESPGKLKTQSRNIFIDSAVQIEGTIKGIRAGRLRRFGLDEQKIRRFLPVTVMLDDNPITPFTGPHLAERIKKSGLLQDADVAPLSVLDAAALEFIELGAQNGAEFISTLSAKVDEAPWDSFGNFCLRRGPAAFVKGPNKYLARVFKTISADVHAWSRAHARPGSSWTRPHVPHPEWLPPATTSDAARAAARRRQRKAVKKARQKSR